MAAKCNVSLTSAVVIPVARQMQIIKMYKKLLENGLSLQQIESPVLKEFDIPGVELWLVSYWVRKPSINKVYVLTCLHSQMTPDTARM